MFSDPGWTWGGWRGGSFLDTRDGGRLCLHMCTRVCTCRLCVISDGELHYLWCVRLGVGDVSVSHAQGLWLPG